MKEETRIVIAVLAVFLILPFILFAVVSDSTEKNNIFDYVKITDVDYTAIVVDEPDCNGKVIITERLTFDVHAASRSNLFWELWRELPESYVDGVKVDYKVNYVKQILKDGTYKEYTNSPVLYWNDEDFTGKYPGRGPGKWYHSKGPYNETKRQYECVLFYVDGLYRDTVTFEIEYEMNNASLRYGDCSELYLSLYSGETTRYLKHFKGQILFPNDLMPNPGNYDAYTYGTNSHTFPFSESSNVNPGYYTFSFDLFEPQLKFKPYSQFIEFLLVSHGDDKHVFTKYASENDYYFDDVLAEIYQEQADYEAIPQKYARAKLLVLIVFSTLTFLLLMIIYAITERVKNKNTFYKPSIQIDFFREIPSELDPIFAANLVFCKSNSSKKKKDRYSATMLSLVRKGYIGLERYNTLRDWDTENIQIIVKYNPFYPQTNYPVPSQSLTPTEGLYFNLILRHAVNSNISLTFFQQRVKDDYEFTNTFISNLESEILRIGVSKDFFQKTQFKSIKRKLNAWALTLLIFGALFLIISNLVSNAKRLGLSFGAFFIFGLGLILSAYLLNKQAKKSVLLTQNGEDEYMKWRGLYNFLNSETLMNERTVIELPLWEQYLVYATAFGISKKVIKALSIRCENVAPSPVLSNPYCLSRSFFISSNAFRSATRTAVITSRSGGYSGYGGSSVGGRGGGGGGGGH